MLLKQIFSAFQENTLLTCQSWGYHQLVNNYFSSLFPHFYAVTTFDLKKRRNNCHWIQVLTDSEHHYWKAIWKVLHTWCPKKVTEFQIEMAANIWSRKSFFFLKTEVLSYLAG